MGTGVGSTSTSTENAQTECVSCGKPYSGSHKCHKCNKLCHAIPPCSTPHSEEGFSASVTCHHCSKEAETNSQQEAAKENQMAQADRMLQRSARQLAPLKVGNSVMVPIPEVDRGRAEFPNVKGIVMEILEEQLRTEESSICPQSEWKRLMIENMDGNVSSSRMAIQSSMYQKFDGYKFFVSCMPSLVHSPDDKGLAMNDLPSKMQFVSNGEAYCNHGKDNIWCTLVALIG
ncbi:hypothetical protein DdX_08489 [Ditylenchus destructor]|uniref:SCAN domain-containing protein n=1 Tax=Ditylenchus destructor TaxID=166010 RepID=A0AAD4R0T4_9BILA|nr:hypothetical protein DdX_08489 [Ditylenchus destructor]